MESDIIEYNKFIDSIPIEDQKKLIYEASIQKKRKENKFWAKICKLRKEIANNKCEFPGCNKTKKLKVHHTEYIRRGCENWDDLKILCEKHHIEAHREDPCKNRHNIKKEIPLNEIF
jgi:hypothetical protein